MRRLAIIGACGLIALAGCGRGAETTTTELSRPEAIRQSDAFMTQRLTVAEPGCSAAVAVAGELVWSGARGRADVETGRPLTVRDRFDFASVSKQFTATAILQLQRDGKLSLTDTLDRWVPGLPAWARTVAVADLIHHRTGIPDYTVLLAVGGVAIEDRATQADALAAITAVENLRATPGTTFEYSNSNYVLLAEVAKAAAGMPFAELLERRVFGEHDLRLAPGTGGTVRAYAAGRPVRSGWLQVGDGSVVGTPSALARWADHYRTGTPGGREMTDRAIADAVPTGGPDGGRYGPGVLVGEDGTLDHGGLWAGTATLFSVSADRDTAIVVSCNDVDAPHGPLIEELRRIWT